jgi:23S rRNA (cytidine2498-2'-O)-methyltransferase
MPDFIFATCQLGAEAALKAEVARNWPELRFAYSRPGFLTFKLSPRQRLAEECDLGLVFARANGFSLGKSSGGTIEERAASVWKLAGERPQRRLHLWRRDLVGPDFRGKVAEPPPSVAEIEAAIVAAAPSGESAQRGFEPGQPTRPGDPVLDCVVVEPDEWWVGMHRARSVASCWPGGLFQVDLPPEAVSRAWLKMEEALVWSGLPLAPGDLCVEIGSAPGGASQALLGHGVHVIGVDPADMDPRVLSHPGFAHWKMRGADVRRREYRKVRWLFADINVAPSYTLDTVESIVTHADVHVQGVLLTLKLIEWSLAADIPAYLERIRSWGFGHVAARQLHHNRQEICVAAQRGRRPRK